MVLEMDNGDNPGIALDNFNVSLRPFDFSSVPDRGPTHSVYGNSQASAPSYDLALLAPHMRVANRLEASLAGEEQLVARAGQMTSPYAWLFWVVLVIVAACCCCDRADVAQESTKLRSSAAASFYGTSRTR